MSTKQKSKTAKSTSKQEITANQFGRNIVMIIDGNKVSKAFKEKEQREEILSMVELYNKRNSKKKLDDIIEFMSKDSTVSKEVEEAKEKATKSKKKPKKEAIKTISLEEAKKMLEKDGYTVSKQAPQSRQRRGEY